MRCTSGVATAMAIPTIRTARRKLSCRGNNTARITSKSKLAPTSCRMFTCTAARHVDSSTNGKSKMRRAGNTNKYPIAASWSARITRRRSTVRSALPRSFRRSVNAKSIPDIVKNTGAVMPRHQCHADQGSWVTSSSDGRTSASSTCPTIISSMAMNLAASSS